MACRSNFISKPTCLSYWLRSMLLVLASRPKAACYIYPICQSSQYRLRGSARKDLCKTCIDESPMCIFPACQFPAARENRKASHLCNALQRSRLGKHVRVATSCKRTSWLSTARTIEHDQTTFLFFVRQWSFATSVCTGRLQ